MRRSERRVRRATRRGLGPGRFGKGDMGDGEKRGREVTKVRV